MFSFEKSAIAKSSRFFRFPATAAPFFEATFFPLPLALDPISKQELKVQASNQSSSELTS
jgi:hypothetical protein